MLANWQGFAAALAHLYVLVFSVVEEKRRKRVEKESQAEM